MLNETLGKEFAQFLASLPDLDLVEGQNLFYGAPPREDAGHGKPVIVYVGPATPPLAMYRMVDKNVGGVTTKQRTLTRVQVIAWGTDPAVVMAKVEAINNRVNQYSKDPPAPLVSGGKWDVQFIETDTEPQLSDFDRLERSAAQVRFKVSAFRRF